MSFPSGKGEDLRKVLMKEKRGYKNQKRGKKEEIFQVSERREGRDNCRASTKWLEDDRERNPPRWSGWC